MTGEDSGKQRYLDLGTVYVVGLLVLGVVTTGVLVHDLSTGGELKQYTDKSEQWCNDHNGGLVNVQSIWHGGLHCDLPNGTSVHMTKVIDT